MTTPETRPCCAHPRVEYLTKQVWADVPEGMPGYGGQMRVTRRWWECCDCGLPFAPAPPTTGEAADEEWRRANQSVAHLHTPLNGLVAGAAAGAMSDERLAEIRGLMATAVFSGDTPRRAMWDMLDEISRLRSSLVAAAADGSFMQRRRAELKESMPAAFPEVPGDVLERAIEAQVHFELGVKVGREQADRLRSPGAAAGAMSDEITALLDRMHWPESEEDCEAARAEIDARLRSPGAAAGAMSDERLAEIRALSVKARAQHDEMTHQRYRSGNIRADHLLNVAEALEDTVREVDRLRSSPVSAADGALREAVAEAADELENDPKTRTCYNVAAALRAALSRVPPSVAANEEPNAQA